MKKTLLILTLACGFVTAQGQGLVSKKGERILPEAGDWALGIDATPFFNYAGNFFGKANNNNAPAFFSLGNQVIIGKYFVDSTKAYRGGLLLGHQSNTSHNMVRRLPVSTSSTNPFPDPDPMVENSWTRTETNIGLTAGAEWRRGKTRLQGYYGAELGLFYSSTRDRFNYGNALNATPAQLVDVSMADQFGGANNVSSLGMAGIPNFSRITDRKTGGSFALGVRGFIGVEYFILPKISIGGELGWGLGFATAAKTVTHWESIGNSDPLNAAISDGVGTTVIETQGPSSFFVDTDNNNSFFGGSGTLRLNFHF